MKKKARQAHFELLQDQCKNLTPRFKFLLNENVNGIYVTFQRIYAMQLKNLFYPSDYHKNFRFFFSLSPNFKTNLLT